MGGYVRPATLEGAFEALAAGVREGRPRVIVAGATDHYPARVGRAPDEEIIDISALPGFREVREADGGWWIPAGATWTGVVDAPLPACFDGLKRAARAIGGRQIQNRATLVGNLCNASPAGDGIPNLLALEAVVELASGRGVRRLPVAAFVTGNRATLRAADELATGLWVPAIPGGDTRSTFLKLGTRAYLVISIAMVAVVLTRDDHGRVATARVAVGACSPVARRLPALETALAGVQAAPGIGAMVSPAQLQPLSPIDDVRATAAYRREAALVMVRRALEEVVA